MNTRQQSGRPAFTEAADATEAWRQQEIAALTPEQRRTYDKAARKAEQATLAYSEQLDAGRDAAIRERTHERLLAQPRFQLNVPTPSKTLSQIHARRLVEAHFSGKPPSDRNVRGMLRETARQARREITHEHDKAQKDFAHRKRAELDDMLRGIARAREASPAHRQDFARAAAEGKARTEFSAAAREDAVARAMEKVNRREAGEGKEPDRDQGRDRDR